MNDQSSAPIVYSQPDPRFRGEAYEYLRAEDQLPTFEQLNEEDPLCRVKLFAPVGRYTYYVAAATLYEGIEGPVLTGYCISPLGPECDEWGDQDIASIARAPFPLPIERDIHWEPKRLSQIIAEHEQSGR